MLTGAYALDALPEEERRAFEAHLAGCDSCRAEVGEFLETAGVLGASLAEAPPVHLRRDVLSAIDRTRQEPPVTRIHARQPTVRWWQNAIAPAAAILVIAVIGLTALISNLNGRIDELEAYTTRVVDVLAAEDAVAISAEGTDARLFVSADREAGVLLASGLQDLPDELTYELWLIGADGAVPAGLFDVGEDGRVAQVLTGSMDDVIAVGVTVEPAGGSPEPTTDPIILVPIQS